MIVENAERYGLSRALRVPRPRSSQVESAGVRGFLLVPPNTKITEIARKRLAGLKETDQVRGPARRSPRSTWSCGNGQPARRRAARAYQLGRVRYLRAAARKRRCTELKSEVVPEIHSALNLGLDIRIPSRLHSLTKISDCARIGRSPTRADEEAREPVQKELEDRYGPVPEAVRNLLAYSALKTLAGQLASRRWMPRHNLLNVKLPRGNGVDPERLVRDRRAKTPRD